MVRRKRKRVISPEFRQEAIEEVLKGEGAFTPKECKLLEKAFGDGIRSSNIIRIVLGRGFAKFSEATLRKYVQNGLVPGCIRRRGTKGGHNKGSYGLYPIHTLFQIMNVKTYLSGDTITMEALSSKPSYVGQQRLVEVMGTIKEILEKFDAQIDEQQMNGVTVPPEIIESRAEAYVNLRNAHRSTEEALKSLKRLFQLTLNY